MKLDRNIGGDGRGKYGLIRNRRLQQILQSTNLAQSTRAAEAIRILEELDIINWGDTVDTEFWVTTLRDQFANAALVSYAMAAHGTDAEYATEVFQLAARSGPYHPSAKVPD